MANLGSPNSSQTLSGTLTKNELPSRDLNMFNKYWGIESKRFVGSPAGSPSASAGATNRTTHLCGTAEQHFDAMRLIVLSAQATNSATGCTAIVAVSANYTTQGSNANIVPSGGNATWVPVTWASGAPTFDMPATGSSAAWATVTSDWMTISSLARTDSPTVDVPIFMVRIQLPANGGNPDYSRDNTNGVAFDTDALTRGRRWFRSVQVGIDGVATPSSFSVTGDNQAFTSCIVQFRSRGRVMSYMTCGDSIAGGAQSTSYTLGYGQIASVSASTSEFVVDQIQCGWSGQTSTEYLANAKTLITAANPHVASYPVWTPNDLTLTQALADAQFARAMDFVQHCRANDTVPILLTHTPLTTDTMAISTIKLAQTARIKGLQVQGVLVADVYSAVTEFGTLNASGGYGWKTGYNADGTHPNDLGHSVMANVLLPVLQQVVRANS